VTVERVRAEFTRTFGHAPAVIASAPGRVNLIGEHTDYNGGAVLPIAIEARTWVAMRASGARHSRVVSTKWPDAPAFSMRSPTRTGTWSDYVAGPLAMLAESGVAVSEVDIAVESDVPVGAGLSSSAALEVAVAFAAASLGGAEPDAATLAKLAHRAEVEFVGVPCGIMDQHAAARAHAGHALHLECDTGHSEHVPFAQSVLVFDTGVARALRDSAYAARRDECHRAMHLLRDVFPGLRWLANASMDQVHEVRLPPPLLQRAQHVIEEHERVGQAVVALRATGHLPGALLYESHRSLRELYECSTPELDWFVEEAAGQPGVTGARLTGAGWGGCAIAVGTADGLREAAMTLAQAYRQRFAREPRWWITGATPGAEVEWRADEGPA
jgi:galactokinase